MIDACRICRWMFTLWLGLVGLATTAGAQVDSTARRTPIPAPSRPPFIFSGESRLVGEVSNRSGSYSEIPDDFARWEFSPTASIYGVPFTLDVLLSTENSTSRQRINSIRFGLDRSMLESTLLNRAYDKISDLYDLKALEESEGIDRVRDSLTHYGEEGMADVARLKELTDIEKLRDQKLSESVSQLKDLGLASATESFFMNFPALEVGVTYPTYSSLTLQGAAVTGANVEFNPGKFYIAGAGGRTRSRVDLGGFPDPFRSVEFQLPDPTYDRTLAAGRIGFGRLEGSNFILTALYAIDDKATIPLDTTLLPDTVALPLTPMANYVVGASSEIEIIPNQVSFGGEASLGVTTHDLTSGSVVNPDIPGFISDAFDLKVSSSADWAYNLHAKVWVPQSATRFSGSIDMVGPGYQSLGAPNLRHDLVRYQAQFDQRLLSQQLSFTGSFRTEHDNLLDVNPATTTLTSYSAGVGVNIRKLPWLRVIVSPYLQSSASADTSYAYDASTIMLTALAGYSFEIGGVRNASNLTFSTQSNSTTMGSVETSRYDISTLTFYHSVFFKFPLSLYAGVSTSGIDLGGESSRVFTFDLSGAYTLFDDWTSSLGVSIANESGRDDRTGIFATTSIGLWGYGFLELRADQTIYSNSINAALDYKEFVFRTTLGTKW